MTLDEAKGITTLEEAIKNPKEDYQIKAWLCELKRARIEIELLKTTRDRYMADVEKCKEENANLRDEWESERDYADQMEEKEKKAVGENVNLRELVRQYHSAMRCMLETGTWPTDPAWLEGRMRKLGIEVD